MSLFRYFCIYIILMLSFSCLSQNSKETSARLLYGFSSVEGLIQSSIDLIQNPEKKLALFLFLSEKEFIDVVFAHLPEANFTNGPTAKEMYDSVSNSAKREIFNLKNILRGFDWHIDKIYSPQKIEKYKEVVLYKNITVDLKNKETGQIKKFPYLFKTIIFHEHFYRLITLDLE